MIMWWQTILTIIASTKLDTIRPGMDRALNLRSDDTYKGPLSLKDGDVETLLITALSAFHSPSWESC